MLHSKIQIGNLYCFPKINVQLMDFDNPFYDIYSKKTRALHKGTPFVPLEVIVLSDYDHIITSAHCPFYRIKVLLTDGTIWYISINDENVEITLKTI